MFFYEQLLSNEIWVNLNMKASLNPKITFKLTWEFWLFFVLFFWTFSQILFVLFQTSDAGEPTLWHLVINWFVAINFPTKYVAFVDFPARFPEISKHSRTFDLTKKKKTSVQHLKVFASFQFRLSLCQVAWSKNTFSSHFIRSRRTFVSFHFHNFQPPQRCKSFPLKHLL